MSCNNEDCEYYEFGACFAPPQIQEECPEYNETEEFLEEVAIGLKPLTHCCECTPGDSFERHFVHIQYPNCTCDPKKYVLKTNSEITI